MSDPFEFNLDDDDDSDTEVTPLNVDNIRASLPSYPIEKVCGIIVCNRYLNLHKDLTIFCMQELAKRRAAGDTFKYEDFIENSYKELPVLTFSGPDLRSMLAQSIGKKK